MVEDAKISLPGKYKIISGKHTEDPKRPSMILKRVYELGVISDELIISPQPLRGTKKDDKNEKNHESIKQGECLKIMHEIWVDYNLI